MSKKEKLLKRFLQQPKDFHFDELVRLLGFFGYSQTAKGKTAGSLIKFINDEGEQILLHKPHPNGIMKMYQLRQIKEKLKL